MLVPLRVAILVKIVIVRERKQLSLEIVAQVQHSAEALVACEQKSQNPGLHCPQSRNAIKGLYRSGL